LAQAKIVGLLLKNRMVGAILKQVNFCLKLKNRIKWKKPDNVVYSVEAGYNANVCLMLQVQERL
jgi:hypothetical protein